MLRIFLTKKVAIALPLLVAFAGCGQSKSVSVPAPPATSSQTDSATDAPGATASADAQISEALDKLSGEDRALAERQKICPVSGEPLGTMGTPKKVDVKGQAVFICCAGCEEQLLANPDEYLAKLNK